MSRAAIEWLDERVSLKSASAKVGTLARVLIVSTFIDDTIRIAFDYSGQVDSMKSVGFGSSASPILPVIFVLIQASGAGLTLAGPSTLWSVGAVELILWSAAHPFLYAQQENTEFLVESVSIIGGLLILLSSSTRELQMTLPVAGTDADADAHRRRMDRVQLAGRCCLSALFIYYALKAARERLTALFFHSDESALSGLVEGVLLGVLAPLTALLVMGMRSRGVAAVLAVAVALGAVYSHPWVYAAFFVPAESQFRLNNVIGYEGVTVPAWIYASHQRYFFFQQISTAGALLMLVVQGPGRLAIEPDQGPLAESVRTLSGVKGVD